MMKSTTRVAGIAAMAFAGSSLAASAALLDLTDETSYDTRSASEATGMFGNVGWRLTSNPGESLTYTAFDGIPSDLGPLKGDFDGVGVGDDEITYDDDAAVNESVTITFDSAVSASGFYFLDLFNAQDADTNEIAEVFLGSDTDGPLLASFNAADAAVVGNDSGFRFGTLETPAIGTAFTFSGFAENDNVGFADYALAGLDAEPVVAPIPLPAGALLLGSGLLAFGGAAAKRRRKA